MFPYVPTNTLMQQQPSAGGTSIGSENTADTTFGSSTVQMAVIVSVVMVFLTILVLVIVFTTESEEDDWITPMILPAPDIPGSNPPEVAHDDSDNNNGGNDHVRLYATESAADDKITPMILPAPDIPGSNPPEVAHDDADKNDGTLYAGLTCVTSERAATDAVDYVQLYQPCDNVIYSVGSICGAVGPKAGLQAIAALDEDKAKYVGFDYDGSQDAACYASLAHIDGWANNGYAALSVEMADDFSDVADVAVRVKFAFDAIKGTSDVDTPKIAGIKINPADADVTKENAEKLRDLLSGVSLVIFQSHPERDVVPCTIAISNVLISKKNMIKLMEDVDLPVAISTTAALALITTDGQQTEPGSTCVGVNLVPRSTRCSLIGARDRDGHSVPSAFSNTVVIEYLITASATSLLPGKSVKHRTKYGVAVFNLDYYYLDQYPECPSLNLSAFKLPRPDQQ